MRKPLRKALAGGKALLCDGAMGTMLQAAALELGGVPEMLNLRRPERVLAVHLAYLAAGADIITSNTFGGSRIKLARAGVPEVMETANRAGAEIARQAAGQQAYVAGSMGPTGELLEPYGNLAEADAIAAFAAQARALAEGGVDVFLIETMSDLREVQAAVAGIRQVSELPIFCTMTFDTGGRTMMGVSPAYAAAALADLGLDGFGANCGVGPEEMEAVVRDMLRERPQAVVIAQPNAGLPSVEEDRPVYSVDAESMAEFARRYAALGVRVIGSCCGSTPAHTAAIARALEGYR